jgi:DNA modification methylase
MTYQIITGNNKQVLKTFPDNHFDSIVTDPPYGIDFLGKAWDVNTGDLETYQECLRVLKPGGYILAFSAAKTYHHLAITLEQAGFEIRDQIMWIYSTKMPKGNNLKPAHEPIALACKGKPNKLNIDLCRIARETMTYPTNGIKRQTFNETKADKWTGETKTNDKGGYPHNVIGEIPDYQKFFYCPRTTAKEKQAYNNHPTVKPVALMEYLIKLVTPPGGLVLDPFNGSGSTGIAAELLGMDYVGIELDPNYCEIAKKRIETWSYNGQTK